MKEENAYILGTDFEELPRLGVQHQVWASEAQTGWNKAGFKAGDTLLDLGSGPGFGTKELAYVAGTSGKVVGVDLSEHYIRHLEKITETYQLNIDPILSGFDDMELADNSFDGMYCRWDLAWLPNPKEILAKVHKNMKKGGKMVIHEYYDWSTHQTEPQLPVLNKAIQAALQSFYDSPGDINVGRRLPAMLTDIGMQVSSIRLMHKLGRPNNLIWQWPKTFYHSYFPRIAEMGYLTTEEVTQALDDMETLESNPNATLFCPIMVEVIAEK